MCQEIQYREMRKPECAKARASPKLEHQNTCKKNIDNKLSHKTSIIRSIAVKNKNEMTKDKEHINEVH